MKTRLGKIAQLPKPIRDDLNLRLENGQQSPELLEWLNGLPETQELIAQKFANQPITRSNLSDWRQGGFLDWHADQLREARIQRLCETGDTLEQAERGDLFENFARIAIAEMMTDLDALQKLRGEKRSERLHHIIRDLARLQNAYNRSRWADLAWTKHNENNGTGVSPVCTEASLPSPNSQLLTSSSSDSVVPDRAGSHAGTPARPEPDPIESSRHVLHFTDCDCNAPCPKCHGPDSDYPHAEAVRDHAYYRKYGRSPRDRDGKPMFLINVACDCFCDRCAGKINGKASLPQGSVINHAESRDETPSIEINPPIPLVPTVNTSPLRPSGRLTPIPPAQLADFSRRMALLKTATQ